MEGYLVISRSSNFEDIIDNQITKAKNRNINTMCFVSDEKNVADSNPSWGSSHYSGL